MLANGRKRKHPRLHRNRRRLSRMRAATLVRQEPHQVSQNPQKRIRAALLASLVHQTRKRSLYPKQRLNPRKFNQPLKLKQNHTQVAILVHQVAPRASQAQALIRDRNPPPRLKQNHRLVEPLATLSQPKKAAVRTSTLIITYRRP